MAIPNEPVHSCDPGPGNFNVTELSKDNGRATITIRSTWDGVSVWPNCDGPIVDITFRNTSAYTHIVTFPNGRAAKTRSMAPGVNRVLSGSQLTTAGLVALADTYGFSMIAPDDLTSFNDAGADDPRLPTLPDASQARLIAVRIPAGDLRVGDQVGSSDVTRAPAFTITGVPERSGTQEQSRRRGDGIELSWQRQGRDGTISTVTAPANINVFVRRYETLISVVRVSEDGTEATDLDVIRVILRPSPGGSTLEIVNAREILEDLNLSPRDRLVFTTPTG